MESALKLRSALATRINTNLKIRISASHDTNLLADIPLVSYPDTQCFASPSHTPRIPRSSSHLRRPHISHPTPQDLTIPPSFFNFTISPTPPSSIPHPSLPHPSSIHLPTPFPQTKSSLPTPSLISIEPNQQLAIQSSTELSLRSVVPLFKL